MRRRTFLTVGTEGIKAMEAIAGDVCLYNKTTQKLVIIETSKLNSTVYPSSDYTPIGVVVVPGIHDVYGTGECAIVSLYSMSVFDPNNGVTEEGYAGGTTWGSYKYNVTELKDFSNVCLMGTSTIKDGTIQGVDISGDMPSDDFNGILNPYDTDTWYNSTTSYMVDFIPSPYNEDETRNPAYYQTSSPSSTDNALSDFDGIGNTEILCNLATTQSDWKTASSITNSTTGTGYYPAACCCWRYHTDGTKQVDWYLPAMGELGYMMVKYKKIKQTFELIKQIYGLGINLSTGTYLSSTEDNYEFPRNLNTGTGRVERYITTKDKNTNTRAFIRVK